jgi:hypothetical protein
MTAPLTRGDITALMPHLTSLSDPVDAMQRMDLLRLLHGIGRRDLPLGRLFEGHVDALQIINRYGSNDQVLATQRIARDGGVFGVWNADRQDRPLRWADDTLDGGKAFASGAGILTHALVSFDTAHGRQLCLVDLARMPPQVDRSWWRVTGMARSETHLVEWRDQRMNSDGFIGKPGDYVTEPWFSGGALRFAAVQAGGIAALVDHVREHLVDHDRAADPHQTSRLATLFRCGQGAADGVATAAREWDDADADRTLAHVAAARCAVYEAGERAITVAQAAVGLSAMFVEHPISAVLTDLAVYLRQPGPDAQTMRLGRAVASRLLTPTL